MSQIISVADFTNLRAGSSEQRIGVAKELGRART